MALHLGKPLVDLGWPSNGLGRVSERNATAESTGAEIEKSSFWMELRGMASLVRSETN